MKRYLTLFFLLITSIALCAYPEGAINNIDGSALGWDEANQTWRPLAVDANGNIQSGGTVIDNISVDTSNIETYLKKTDGENTVTISDLINGIGTDTKDIKKDLEVDNKTVTELVNGIGTDTSNINNKLIATFTSSDFPYTTSNKTIAEMLKPIYEAYSKSPDNIPYILTSILNTNGGIATYLGTNVGQDVGAIKTETASLTKQPNELRMQRISNITANVATNVGYIVDVNSPASERIFVELRAIDETAVFYIGLSNAVTDSTGRPVKGRILLNIPKTQSLYIYHTNASAINIQQTEGWR